MYRGLVSRGYQVFTLYRNKRGYADGIPNQYQIPDPDYTSEANIDFIASFLKERKIAAMINLGAIFNHSSICAVEACKKANVPHIAVYHNTLDMPLRASRLTRGMMSSPMASHILRCGLGCVQRLPLYKGGKYIYRNSTDVVLLAECYRKEYERLICHDYEGKLKVIYNPLAMPYPTVNPDEKRNVALFVGRLEPPKGLDMLLHIWAKARLAGWTLKIVGKGSEKARLMELCSQLNISDTVTFEGQQNPEPYYREARIFCMTSVFEGFPMTLIECQAFGCVPIITDTYPAAAEIISDGVNGFNCKNGDIGLYVNNLNKLASDSAQWERMAREAVTFSRKFNPKSIINDWCTLLSKYFN